MTNKERYQRTFSVLHAPELDLEDNTMEKRKRIHISKMAAFLAAAVMMVGAGTAAYAADVGGIQRKVQIWLHGDQTDAVLEINQEDNITQYDLSYKDENGEEHEMHGGGVAFDMYGNEIPLSEGDIMNQISNYEDVEYKDDGTVWVYYKDQKIEITDDFDEDGFCFVTLKDGDEKIYMTIKYQDGYGTSTTDYPDKKEFE